jgi:hypothetical protein
MDPEEADELGASFSIGGSGSLSLPGGLKTAFRTSAKSKKKKKKKKKKTKPVKKSSSNRTAILRGMMKAKPKASFRTVPAGARLTMSAAGARRMGATKYKAPTYRSRARQKSASGKVQRFLTRTRPSPLSRGVIGPVRRTLPISKTAPAAYRHLACNAGVGGDAGLALLKQIKALVQLTNTRMLATSEHHNINNTKAFRRAVLKGLMAKRRACR